MGAAKTAPLRYGQNLIGWLVHFNRWHGQKFGYYDQPLAFVTPGQLKSVCFPLHDDPDFDVSIPAVRVGARFVYGCALLPKSDRVKVVF